MLVASWARKKSGHWRGGVGAWAMDESESKWVDLGIMPVSLPWNGQYVLVVHHGKVNPAYWRAGEGFELTSDSTLIHPTHWMPLPEPPRVDDPFEAWWEKTNKSLSAVTCKDWARIGWDAALASVPKETLQERRGAWVAGHLATAIIGDAFHEWWDSPTREVCRARREDAFMVWKAAVGWTWSKKA